MCCFSTALTEKFEDSWPPFDWIIGGWFYPLDMILFYSDFYPLYLNDYLISYIILAVLSYFYDYFGRIILFIGHGLFYFLFWPHYFAQSYDINLNIYLLFRIILFVNFTQFTGTAIALYTRCVHAFRPVLICPA